MDASDQFVAHANSFVRSRATTSVVNTSLIHYNDEESLLVYKLAPTTHLLTIHSAPHVAPRHHRRRHVRLGRPGQTAGAIHSDLGSGQRADARQLPSRRPTFASSPRVD